MQNGSFENGCVFVSSVFVVFVEADETIVLLFEFPYKNTLINLFITSQHKAEVLMYLIYRRWFIWKRFCYSTVFYFLHIFSTENGWWLFFK